MTNDNIFSKIDSEIKAYCLGLIVSDGYIYSKFNRLAISMADRDCVGILQSLTTTNKIHVRPHVKYKTQYYLEMASKQMMIDLAKYGVVQNKSLTTTFPEIPNEFDRHFIRGIFDGDGGIHLGKCREIHFIGTISMMDGIRERVMDYLGEWIPNPYLRDKNRPDKNTWRLKIRNRNQMIAMRDFLYKDSTYYMKRKFDIMLTIENNFSSEQKYYRISIKDLP